MEKHIEQQEQVSDRELFHRWVIGKFKSKTLTELAVELEEVYHAVDRMQNNKEFNFQQWNDAYESVKESHYLNGSIIVKRNRAEREATKSEKEG